MVKTKIKTTKNHLATSCLICGESVKLTEYERLKLENDKLKRILSGKVLIVEDGSVNIDKLEEDGFYVIYYRQGSRPPMWLTHQHEDKGE